MKTPIELITEERERQQEKEGWTLKHDDQHTDQSLAMAAALYASPDDSLMCVNICGHCTGVDSISDPWPWWDENDSGRGPLRSKAWDKRKQHDRMRRLQIAGALIVAEMERLQRLGVKGKDRWVMCGLCDTAYDPNGEDAKVHEHPEPQSGPPRDAWIKSGMNYSQWIELTKEGRGWASRINSKG